MNHYYQFNEVAIMCYNSKRIIDQCIVQLKGFFNGSLELSSSNKLSMENTSISYSDVVKKTSGA